MICHEDKIVPGLTGYGQERLNEINYHIIKLILQALLEHEVLNKLLDKNLAINGVELVNFLKDKVDFKLSGRYENQAYYFLEKINKTELFYLRESKFIIQKINLVKSRFPKGQIFYLTEAGRKKALENMDRIE